MLGGPGWAVLLAAEGRYDGAYRNDEIGIRMTKLAAGTAETATSRSSNPSIPATQSCYFGAAEDFAEKSRHSVR
jgi:hypothetical protein